MKCAKCRGQGTVRVVAERLTPFSYRTKSVPCGACAGTGKAPEVVPAIVQLPTSLADVQFGLAEAKR